MRCCAFQWHHSDVCGHTGHLACSRSPCASPILLLYRSLACCRCCVAVASAGPSCDLPVLREASHLRKHSSRLASASEPIPCCLCRGSSAQSCFERGCALAFVLGCGQHIGPGFHDIYQFALHIPRVMIPVSRGRCLSIPLLPPRLRWRLHLLCRRCWSLVNAKPPFLLLRRWPPFPCEESSSSVSVAAEVVPASYGPYVLFGVCVCYVRRRLDILVCGHLVWSCISRDAWKLGVSISVLEFTRC